MISSYYNDIRPLSKWKNALTDNLRHCVYRWKKLPKAIAMFAQYYQVLFTWKANFATSFALSSSTASGRPQLNVQPSFTSAITLQSLSLSLVECFFNWNTWAFCGKAKIRLSVDPPESAAALHCHPIQWYDHCRMTAMNHRHTDHFYLHRQLTVTGQRSAMHHTSEIINCPLWSGNHLHAPKRKEDRLSRWDATGDALNCDHELMH